MRLTTMNHHDGRTDSDAGPIRRRVRPRRSIVGRLALAAVFAAVLVVATATATHAAEPDRLTHVVAIADSVDEVLDNIRNWLMGILAALATVFLTVGGVLYMMAAGDVGQVERAKTSFKAAGIGYALAALAPLVVQVLEGIVGA